MPLLLVEPQFAAVRLCSLVIDAVNTQLDVPAVVVARLALHASLVDAPPSISGVFSWTDSLR